MYIYNIYIICIYIYIYIYICKNTFFTIKNSIYITLTNLTLFTYVLHW